MQYLSLMFSDENISKNFHKEKFNTISQDVIKDLTISNILEEIKKTTPDFPEDFLLFPPYDFATQNLRRETAKEIYHSSVVFEKLKEFAVSLHVLKKHRRNIMDIKNKDAKNQSFLYATVEYFKALKHLCEITENTRSLGLRVLHKSAKEMFCKMENDIFKKAEELLTRVSNMLSVSVRFDFFNQTARIEKKAEVSTSETLCNMSKDLLGTNLAFSFSAVNNVQLSPLEEMILQVMKKRNPEIFEELGRFYEENKFLEFDKLIDLRDEILFFTGYIEFTKKYEKAGFSFSFAEMTQDIHAQGIYDVSLAVKLGNPEAVVANDIEINNKDIFVVSGSNQGGKTTFLRAFGQCAFFASHGLPVPAKSFGAPFYGLIATHFNRTEKVGKSRLEEEIERIKDILSVIGENSLVLFNECFVGTRRSDAVVLSEKVFERLFEAGTTCGFVTHFFELPMRDSRLISFVADISQDGTERRTYHIVKRSPDGLAHAHSIAVACGATYDQLIEETKS